MIQDIDEEIKLPGYQMSPWRKFHNKLSSEVDRELHIKYTGVNGYSLGRLLREIENDIELASSKVMKEHLKRRKSELRREYDMYLKNQDSINSVKEQEAQVYEDYNQNIFEVYEDNYSEDSMP